jgi:hypothetical protein
MPLTITPGFPFTKMFFVKANGVDYPTVYYGPPDADQVIHIKKITVTKNNSITAVLDVSLWIDAGQGFFMVDRFSNWWWTATVSVFSTCQSNFDFYLTEGQQMKLYSLDRTSGAKFVFTIFGEVCYKSNLVEVGD